MQLTQRVAIVACATILVIVIVFSAAIRGDGEGSNKITARADDASGLAPPRVATTTIRRDRKISQQGEGREQEPAAASPADERQCPTAVYRGNCKRYFQTLGKKYFRIHHIHSHNFSIERKVVRLFGPALAKLYCGVLVPDQVAVGSTANNNNNRYGVTIVDIGVNDAEDISYWFERFGYHAASSIFEAEDSCRDYLQSAASTSTGDGRSGIDVSFRLFEPQQMYKDQVHRVLAEALARRRSLAAVSVRGQFDAVAVGSDKSHGTVALFYGKGEQASLGALGKHAAASKPVEVRVGSLAKMLQPSWASDFAGVGEGPLVAKQQQTLSAFGVGATDEERSAKGSATDPILFMKIDCEGADPTIMVDSEALFAARRVHLLVFELHKNERGFPEKFASATSMLVKHGYDVYLIGKCASAEGGVMFVKMDGRAAASWTPVLEAAIALSPQLQKVVGPNLGRYFGGGSLASAAEPSKYSCGAGWEWVPRF